MKTSKRNAINVSVILLILLTAQAALAWYDPSAQRWLNRDPIEERGGQNLYQFVSNDPISKIDPIGKAGCGCSCGPDTSLALSATLGDIKQTFDGWNIIKKTVACAYIFNPITAFDSWDIRPLERMSYPRAGECDCSHTYSLNGRCYYGGSINYVMWGFIVKLCGGDLNAVAAGVTAGKVMHPTYIRQAMEMATYGYKGVDSGATALNCPVQGPSPMGPMKSMDWVWEPYRSRTD